VREAGLVQADEKARAFLGEEQDRTTDARRAS
jgi:hypothetical protein